MSIVLVVTLAGGAHAAVQLSRKSKTAELPADDTAHGLVSKCPRGTVATSGGVRLRAPDTDFMQGSHPSGNRGWRAVGYRPATAGAADVLTSFVLCAKNAGKVTVRSKQVPLGSGVTASQVKCAKGTALVGGGLRLEREDDDYVQGFHPVNARTLRFVGYPGNSEPAHVTGYAVCMKGARTSVVSKARTMSGGGATTVRAGCPKGTRVVGGGVRLGDEVNDYAFGSFPAKNGWKAQGVPWTTGTEVTAYAICLR